MKWWENLRCKILLRHPLKRQTTFKIGGPAQFFVEPQSLDDLRQLLICAKRYRIPLSLIGSGSNILAADFPLRRIVVHLGTGFKKISFAGSSMRCESGLPLNQVIARAAAHGLGGLEFLAGIPGTLGGALVMNAGAWGRSIADRVISVTVMDKAGRVMSLAKRDIDFGYRKSGLGKFIILGTVLSLRPKPAGQINKKVKTYLEKRFQSQENFYPNAGCVFKNPASNISAGSLIDLCGLKGVRRGDAEISRKHANFIINKGNARADDVLKLMRLVKRKVKDKFNIYLEPEIKIWR